MPTVLAPVLGVRSDRLDYTLDVAGSGGSREAAHLLLAAAIRRKACAA